MIGSVLVNDLTGLVYVILLLFSTISSYGVFKLGKTLGITLNIISIIWIIVVVIFSAFPTSLPVTAENANYSPVVMAGWLLFGSIYYVLYGRQKFDVPVVSTVIVGVPTAV